MGRWPNGTISLICHDLLTRLHSFRNWLVYKKWNWVNTFLYLFFPLLTVSAGLWFFFQDFSDACKHFYLSHREYSSFSFGLRQLNGELIVLRLSLTISKTDIPHSRRQDFSNYYVNQCGLLFDDACHHLDGSQIEQQLKSTTSAMATNGRFLYSPILYS